MNWAAAGIKALESWSSSQAKAWTDATVRRLHNFLPGYREASTWSFTRADIAAHRRGTPTRGEGRLVPPRLSHIAPRLDV